MKIFISWSGEFSKQIAESLKKWLPCLINTIDIFYSDADIEKGESWDDRILNELKTCNFGIMCMTSSNVGAPWIYFEAGALSNLENKVTAFLVDIEPQDLKDGSLSMFQATKFEKNDFYKLLKTINNYDNKIKDETLKTTFEALWPSIEKDISSVIEKWKGELNCGRKNHYDVINSKELIENILMTACESLSHQYKDFKVRAIVAKCDYLNNVRKTIYSYNAKPDPEKVAVLPLDFGVVGECLKRKNAIYRELEENHIDTYDEEIKTKISPELKAIIAAPIFKLNDENYNITAILAIDILDVDNKNIDMSNYNLNDKAMLEIVQGFADVLSFLIDI